MNARTLYENIVVALAICQMTVYEP
jgi:hypothetical protein